MCQINPFNRTLHFRFVFGYFLPITGKKFSTKRSHCKKMYLYILKKSQLKFTLLHKDKQSKARVGVIDTDHGKIETPAYVPVIHPVKQTISSKKIKEMGFDRCSNASNHSFDKGVKGIEATLNEFDALGLGQAGMARTPDEIEPKVFDVKGIKVTHLSYTYGFNGIPAPNGETWRLSLIHI